MNALLEGLRAKAEGLGLAALGVADPAPSEHTAFYRAWVESGAHGEMAYLARGDARARRADVTLTMESVRSVVVVAEGYAPDDGRPATDGSVATPVEDPSRAVVARYARGGDYHRVLKKKLLALLRWLDEEVEGGVRGRAYVDTGPILERELGRRAGLGWFGRNTMLIDPARGSYFFLGVLLVDVELPRSQPFEEDRCGTCRACLDACPTGALLGRDEAGAPRIDARRCISYLTIELRGPIPEELRPGVGNRIFGCDVCQEVCPWNDRFARPASEGRYAAREGLDGRSLVELMRMGEEEWDALTRGSAVRRAGYAGFRRNVATALGNWLAGKDAPDSAALDTLAAASGDEDPVVAEAAAWALGRAKRYE